MTPRLFLYLFFVFAASVLPGCDTLKDANAFRTHPSYLRAEDDGDSFEYQRGDRLCYSPDGRTLAVEYQILPKNASVQLLDVSGTWSKHLLRTSGPNTQSVTAIGFAPNGATLAVLGLSRSSILDDGLTGGLQAKLFIYDSKSGDEIALLNDEAVRSFAYCATSDRIVTGSMFGIVRLWDVLKSKKGGSQSLSKDQARILFAGHGKHEHSVNDIRCSKDGSIVVWATSDGKLGVCNLALASPRANTLDLSTLNITLSRHWEWRPSFAVSTNADLIACGDSAGNVHLFDSSLARKQVIPLHSKGTVKLLAFAPGGSTLAALMIDIPRGQCSLSFLDISTGQMIEKIPFYHIPKEFCYSPDGRQIAVSYAARLLFYDTSRLGRSVAAD